jgi:hypothetical protein
MTRLIRVLGDCSRHQLGKGGEEAKSAASAKRAPEVSYRGHTIYFRGRSIDEASQATESRFTQRIYPQAGPTVASLAS